MLMFPSEKVGNITGLPQPLNTPKVLSVQTRERTTSAIEISNDTGYVSGAQSTRRIIYATKGFKAVQAGAWDIYVTLLRDNGSVNPSRFTVTKYTQYSLPNDYSLAIIEMKNSSSTVIDEVVFYE